MAEELKILLPLILSIADFARLMGVSRTTLHRLERDDPAFPRKVQLSTNRVGFHRDDVLQYIAARPASPARKRGPQAVAR